MHGADCDDLLKSCALEEVAFASACPYRMMPAHWADRIIITGANALSRRLITVLALHSCGRREHHYHFNWGRGDFLRRITKDAASIAAC